MSGVNPSSQWEAGKYTTTGAFVAKYGSDVLGRLDPQPGERILDVGCGDGALTCKIADAGAQVLGLDASPELLEVAASRGLQTQLGDATNLGFDQEFDAVFSNAVLHWVLDAQSAAASMYRALKPAGRLAVEFGGFGNIAAIRAALTAVLNKHGYLDLPHDHFYPLPDQYAEILESVGFSDVSTALIYRQTPLADGMSAWLETFRGGFLKRLGIDESQRDLIFTETSELLRPVLYDAKTGWWADYVRLRVTAHRES